MNVARTPVIAAAMGFAALAAAMGIGRFAFTPLLPMMQEQGFVDLRQGSGLAAANYLGYLAGALACMALNPAPRRSMQGGLLVVSLATMSMAAAATMNVWWALRFAAGAGSAFVLVGVSGWALPLLAGTGRAGWASSVFAGVGAGIAMGGCLVWAAASWQLPAGDAWLALGLISTLIAAAAALAPHQPQAFDSSASHATNADAATLARAGLVLYYGLAGLGYIVPATFLPAVAREAETPGFGGVWPAFGFAAAISTLVAGRLHRLPPRRLWSAAQALMAGGVIAPAFAAHPAALWFSALAVGGSFMVVTMAAMREAQRICAPGQALRLMAALTASFGLGQVLGPHAMAAWSDSASAIEAVRMPSLLAGVLLLVSAAALRRGA
jgi:MFS family permease